MFDEARALLILKGGDPFLKSLINEENIKKFYPLLFRQPCSGIAKTNLLSSVSIF